MRSLLGASQREPYREFFVFFILLAVVLVVFARLLDPEALPDFARVPGDDVKIPAGKTLGINIWMAPHGPDCKAIAGWRVLASSWIGTVTVAAVSGSISNSPYGKCNGEPIEGARVDYQALSWYGPISWFHFRDVVTIRAVSANARLWESKYTVTINHEK